MRFPQDDPGTGRPAAGPVAGSGPSSSQAAGKDPDPTPPADEQSVKEPGGPASPAGDESAQGQGAQVEHDLDALAAAEQARDEYLEIAKRAQADFENYRKRMSAEVLAANGRGKSEVLAAVVPVLDDLERALQAAGLDPEGDSEDGLAHGVLLVFRSLRETLVRNGIEPVDPTGERFDPQWHEALSTASAEGAEPGTVIETMQKGYRLGEQLIRPARVVVAE